MKKIQNYQKISSFIKIHTLFTEVENEYSNQEEINISGFNYMLENHNESPSINVGDSGSDSDDDDEKVRYSKILWLFWQ